MDAKFSVDAAVSQAWVAVAHGARMSSRILQSVGDPAPRSNFAQLNAVYPHEKASDWHRSYLGAALEHLVVWADLVAPLSFHPEHVVTHTFRPDLPSAHTLAFVALTRRREVSTTRSASAGAPAGDDRARVRQRRSLVVLALVVAVFFAIVLPVVTHGFIGIPIGILFLFVAAALSTKSLWSKKGARQGQ